MCEKLDKGKWCVCASVCVRACVCVGARHRDGLDAVTDPLTPNHRGSDHRDIGAGKGKMTWKAAAAAHREKLQ